MTHGTLNNGIRKVEITDNLGRASYVHVGPDGSLMDALGDVWIAARNTANATESAYWQCVNRLTARCGSETAVFDHQAVANG